MGAAASAQAAHYTYGTNVLLEAGGTQSYTNTFIDNVSRGYVDTNADPVSSAAVCTQTYTPINGPQFLQFNYCGGVGDRVSTPTIPPDYRGAYGGYHNHSDHQGRFNGSADT